MLTDKKNFKNFKENNQYVRLYKSGFSVFKNYPVFGVGNKNYRLETCKKKLWVAEGGHSTLYTHPLISATGMLWNGIGHRGSSAALRAERSTVS